MHIFAAIVSGNHRTKGECEWNHPPPALKCAKIFPESESGRKNKMAGSFREISISVSRVGNVLKLQSERGNQLVANISSKVFEEKGGGFHFSKCSKLSANRRISW